MKSGLNIFDIANIKRVPYRQDINILRAVAVLSVLFYHAEIDLFKGGWLGVDIFFVISGYLISNIIISDLNNSTFSFKNFYERRSWTLHGSSSSQIKDIIFFYSDARIQRLSSKTWF